MVLITQSKNAFGSMCFNCEWLSNAMEKSEGQSEKHPSPSTSTFRGIVMDAKAVLKNAEVIWLVL
jgi:hypothetical protein